MSDQTEAVQNAINAAVKLGKKLYIPSNVFIGTSKTIVLPSSGAFLGMFSDGTGGFRYVGSSSSGYISPNRRRPVDNSIPNKVNPGPMEGTFLYHTSNNYYMEISGLSYDGYLFCHAFFTASNTPKFTNCKFVRCNAFAFYYQGSQNSTYTNIMTLGEAGPVHISSSTCFAETSPYSKLDNYYSDNLLLVNETAALGASGTRPNDAFDEWFIDSILKPTIPSYTIGNLKGCIYLFDRTAPECRPSGWSGAFIPMRNQRTIYSPRIRNHDSRSGGIYGGYLLNGNINSGVIDGWHWEATGFPLYSHITIGSVQSLLLIGIDTVAGGGRQVPFIKYTGKDFSSGFNARDDSRTNFVGCNITPSIFSTEADSNGYQSISSGRTYGDVVLSQDRISKQNIIFGNDSFDLYRKPYEFLSGISYADGTKLSAWNIDYLLPTMDSKEVPFYISKIKSIGCDFCGILSIHVLDPSKNLRDNAKVYYHDGESYELYNSQPVNNGDTLIPLVGSPKRKFDRFSVFLFNGTSFIANHYDKTLNALYLEVPLSGMQNAAAPNTKITKKAPFLEVIEPFKLKLVDFYLSNGVLCLDSSNFHMKDSIKSIYKISLSFSNNELAYTGYFDELPDPIHFRGGALINVKDIKNNGYIKYYLSLSQGAGIWKKLHDS